MTTNAQTFGIGDRVALIHVMDDRVVRIVGTVVGLGTVQGLHYIKVEGVEDWSAVEAAELVADGAGRRLP
jgi:hypothetical protein